MLSRIILGISGFIFIIIMSAFLPILKTNFLYLILSYFVVFESIFMMDFLFRGYEKMDIIAKRFVIMKVISTLLTFILIRDDSDLLLIPILDIISSFIALITIFKEYKKLKIKARISNNINVLKKIKESGVYFLSNAATTSFNAFGTLVIGILLDNSQVAFWGVCMQIIGTIQALYSPICDGIYPEMLKTKSIFLLRKTFIIFFPIVLIGSLLCYLFAPFGMYILGGSEYQIAVPIFRLLIPCLILSFPAILLGWSTLGAIEKQNLVTKSTIISLIFNIVSLLLLIPLKKFTLDNIAIIRVLTELIMLIYRIFYLVKYKDKFNYIKYEKGGVGSR
jgi:PST family polysaccharide transporter